MRRRHLLGAGALIGASAIARAAPVANVHVALNENPFGPSPRALAALRDNLPLVARYGDAGAAAALLARIATLEQLPETQIVPGEILGALGLLLAAESPAGARFVYSDPGYTALVDAGRPAGAVGLPVPLDRDGRNDLTALLRASAGARALYLVNPHNPTGTTNDPAAWDRFIRAAAAQTLVIVDEAYLEYDSIARSAVHYTREGLNVAVFRTLDKIYGLAGLPIGYVLAPTALAERLRAAGLGDPHELGRLPIAAATAALADQAWVAHVRALTLAGRARLTATLDALRLRHTDSRANFVFFEAPPGGREALLRQGIVVAKTFPPLTDWVRISVGTPDEVTQTIGALRAAFG